MFVIIYIRNDPEWTRKTFLEAASALKIKPIQAYKWGYHKKLKENENENENQNEEKQAETKVIDDIISSIAYYNEIFLISL